MPIVAVNVIKVLFVIAMYGFLSYVARSMRGHVAGPPVDSNPTPAPPSVEHSSGRSQQAPGRSIAILDEAGEPTKYPLDGVVVVGRGATADVQIEDDYASENHASFVVEGGAVVVEDLGSTNGTTIDGRRIEGRVEVEGGTTLIVGRTRVVVE